MNYESYNQRNQQRGAIYRRRDGILLRFADADSVYRELRFPVSKLGIADPRLDQEVEVMIVLAEVGK